MGQALALGSEKTPDKFEATIGDCYDKFLAKSDTETTLADFYHAVCETVEEINKKINSTQLRLPNKEQLRTIYQTNYDSNERKVISKQEFQKILQEAILQSGLTGFGSKDTLLYIFGVPALVMFIKQRLAPRIMPNDVLIPGATSATVFLLAKLNKI